MRFTGNLSETDSLKTGFLKFPYTNKEGNSTWLAATHFEPDGARQVFPCWDEPALKATFNISIMHHQKYMVLSNMPRRKVSIELNDMIWTHFYTTPIMSTYLVVIVAIIQSDYVTIINKNENISMLCRSSLTSQVTFAHSIVERIMPFLIQYTNNSEKVPKVDNILIPNFPVEGMENWGLIMYRELHAVYNTSTDPTYKRREIAKLVTHELVHQWFGNLVTASWWSYLWLNEGFAVFFQTYIINKFSLERSLDVLRMFFGELCNLYSSKIVYHPKRELRYYIDDLWSAMQSALDESDVPHEGYRIKEVMDTWINQERYPVVNVMRNYETGEVTLSQRCFRAREMGECINSTWWIPVTYATESNPDFSNAVPKFWLRPNQNVSFKSDPNDWIILNVQQTGYYRVNYDTRNWHKISYYLHVKNYTSIHVLNRAQIISDSYTFMMEENKEMRWLSKLLLLPGTGNVKIRMLDLLDRLLQNVGYEENLYDDDITKLKRLDVLKWACIIGHVGSTNLVFCIDDNLKVIHRLPNNTIPVHYNIYLTLHLKEGNFTFYGESNVNIEIRFASSQISLHSKELEINETATTLVNDKGTVYKPMEYTYNNATNILILHFDHELSPSFYTLNMRFTGNLSESTDSRKTGIFKIPYTSEQGNTTWLAATHFEPDGARQVFPCWDEPALKATFNISIMNYDKYMALSNMPRRNISFEPNDMTWTYFDTTPIMSTYLVVIVAISRADFITISNANLNVSTLFRFSLQSQVRFAQDIAERAMTFLIQYTNNSEKVPKVDNILIPNFPIEGMENWGLITYKESSSTYDDRTDPTYKRKDVASLVAHEIAHQWFGNLVTPSWWSYIWLSEGLATFFETYIIDKIFKDWRTMDFFVVKTLHNCLMVDIGLMNSVTLKLDNVLEDELLFSIISKSISILVSEVYQKDDLWSAMQSALDESDVPHEGYRIREVMNTWINQKRYPVINVMRNYETGEVTLSQTCFRTQDTAECINSTWWIPVTYATQSNPDFSNVIPKFWLRPDQNISFRINPNDWIILNLQQTGYYRINYDTRNWHKISYYLNSENYANVHVLNRAQIISDSYVLSMDENKEINGVLFVNLVSYLERETDYVAWYPMFKIVEYIWSSKYLFLTEAKSIKIRIMYLLNTLLKNVGYDENSYDDDITKLKRQAVLKWTCILGHAGCKEIASERLSQHLANPDTHKISNKNNV
ncbi:PREDICTED: aminopeptidase Q-like [Cyphomyrmex costatus]|uniref:aminopeptidase Q-like n=1 Tax=Cyphomyrmex costatus TaxID=456900 RepID=UPI0008522272|nr:PREDICTED: aminopeptidase Q-like [Cyphomyrmex costatus]